MHNSDLDDDEVSEDELYRNKGFADVQAAYELMECIDWKLEKIITSTGDRIQSIQRKKLGKIYRLTVSVVIWLPFSFYTGVINLGSIWMQKGQVNMSASGLFRRLYNGMEEVPSWNPTVLQARVLRVSDYNSQTHIKQSQLTFLPFDSIENR